MKFSIGSIVDNHLTNGKVIVVRIVGIVPSKFTGSADMYRVTDNLNASSFDIPKLISNNETWPAPEENITAHDSECYICHKNGLVVFGQ